MHPVLRQISWRNPNESNREAPPWIAVVVVRCRRLNRAAHCRRSFSGSPQARRRRINSMEKPCHRNAPIESSRGFLSLLNQTGSGQVPNGAPLAAAADKRLDLAVIVPGHGAPGCFSSFLRRRSKLEPLVPLLLFSRFRSPHRISDVVMFSHNAAGVHCLYL